MKRVPVSKAKSLPTLSTSAEQSPPRGDAPLAPRWHTALLVAVMLAVAITGTLLQYAAVAQSTTQAVTVSAKTRIVARYFPILLVNWGLVLYVSRLFLTRNALPTLLGRGWPSAQRACVDLALAGCVCAAVEASELLWVRCFGVRPNAALAALLPSTGAERLSWLIVAVSVGFCEEVVYRGYLQRQLSAFSRRASAGIALQAVLFGIAHGEQGSGAALRMAAYGLLFGALARFRGSLLPGIAAHVGIDLVGGLLR